MGKGIPPHPPRTEQDMARKNKATAQLRDEHADVVEMAAIHTEEPSILEEYGPPIHPDVAADIEKARSVVKNAYKQKYAERARSNGHASKVAQRSTWDWLAQSLAGECNGPDGRIDIAKFLRVLDLNGVDHSRWTNRSKGWEGRLRMTGRLALQRVVAAAGVLVVEGDETVAPAEWVAKHRH